MKTSLWIHIKDVTQQLLDTLEYYGYTNNQQYFESINADTLITTHTQKTYTFARFEDLCCDYDPHRSWLTERDCVLSEDEFIQKIKEIEHDV